MDLRAVLSLPKVYSSFQNTIGQRRDMYVSEYVRPLPGQRVLDIGCGPADVLVHFPDVEYVGVDLSPDYIDAARKRFGHRASFHCMDAAEYAVKEPKSFDIVMANGLLHHLDNESAHQVFSIARAALKDTGYMVSFDGCYTPKQSLVVRTLLNMDRGKFVRTEEEYVRLAKQTFASVRTDVRGDFFRRLPYTIVFMVCGGAASSNSIAGDVETTQKSPEAVYQR